MPCKDCNGSGIYQPLIGPPEPCRKCQDAPIKNLMRVDFLTLSLSRAPGQDVVGPMVKTLIREGFNSFYHITVRKWHFGYLVTDGTVRVAALRRLYNHASDAFNRILPDGQIPILVMDNQQTCGEYDFDELNGPL